MKLIDQPPIKILTYRNIKNKCSCFAGLRSTILKSCQISEIDFAPEIFFLRSLSFQKVVCVWTKYLENGKSQEVETSFPIWFHLRIRLQLSHKHTICPSNVLVRMSLDAQTYMERLKVQVMHDKFVSVLIMIFFQKVITYSEQPIILRAFFANTQIFLTTNFPLEN